MALKINEPTEKELTDLIGKDRYCVYLHLSLAIEKLYGNYKPVWYKEIRTQTWNYQKKYRDGKKNLCSLFLTDHLLLISISVMKRERCKFQAAKQYLSTETQQNFHDEMIMSFGKRVVLDPIKITDFKDILKLLSVKKEPTTPKP